MRHTLPIIFTFLIIISCRPEKSKQQECNLDLLNEKIKEAGLKAYNVTTEENKLIQNLKECADFVVFKEIIDFNQLFINPVIKTTFIRQSDLILASGETTSRDEADTLTYIKMACENSKINEFITNGFEKLIESDLKYYEIEIQGEDAYKHYGKGMDTNLKKYWKENYNNKMTLAEIIILLKEIRIIIYQNNLILEKNALYECSSRQ